MPKISVIIPVHNVEKYLDECLLSIMEQTFKDIEIICIDDGSTDNCAKILDEYSKKDNRFVIIKQQKNMGPSITRNYGMVKANGDYITFVDSDDYLISKDYLEKLYYACIKYDADIAVAGIIRNKNGKNKKLLELKKQEMVIAYIDKLRICNLPDLNYVWNKLYKRDALIKSGIIFPPNKLYEDISFTHKILYYTGKLISVPKIAYFYRDQNNSIVNTQKPDLSPDYKIFIKNMRSFFAEHNIKESDLISHTNKYRLFGLTLFKTITRYKRRKNILFNCITWYTKEREKYEYKK